jgi:hypothetical protein
MNRIFVAVAALSMASAALGQESGDAAVDTAALQGRLTSLEEQYAETKSTVAGLSRIKWSGYIQARYAYQQCVPAAGSTSGDPTKGCSYSTAEQDPKTGQAIKDSNPARDNFFIRRGRLKVVYDADLAQFVLQLDATPDGVSIKEGYASVKLPKGWSVDAGLQLMPFGYDVGVRSSSDLDLLERFRGAGYFLKGEYDIGVALKGAYGPLNFRGGVFNGNGIDGGAGKDNDQIKDFIGRVGFDFGMITGGVSGWYGNTRDYHVYPAKTYKRNRIGADLQVYLDLLPIGGTALKGEYIAGTTGIGTKDDAGKNLGQAGYAWHATITQNLGSPFQLAARYEQYQPINNLDEPAAGKELVKRIDELDVAVHYFVGGNYKLSVAYWHPMNGKVLGSGAPNNAAIKGTVKETDQFVVQAQAKF